MAGQPYIYSGQGFSLLRDKNRFVLPNQFRGTVRESSGKAVLCLGKHDRWDCLTGFGLSRVEDFDQQIREEQAIAIQSGKEYDADKRAFDLHSFYEVPFDGSGRFVMPEDLFALADIGDQLYFQGAGRFFTVWNPEKLYALDQSWAVAQTACRNLAAKEIAKARKK
ncbi:division/cell wall cluster transcriptional repressor MraZ [Novosphingobium album (ex Liu et al. 2023)]|uniref:Division/cell wall cluster transcriptional repressor MraZ n=1 Tax=Novosphingobium album (ex Liu et al. 2023) TaxID=3031130 RepID=A0ABT5WK17_9SPHN|nr:division/cell wall cluster transcriptional repressor MraZ [Novosphingobium album (ex Liu et al. 2023)]MDE8650388.1 division/cell wall cluster transcriptional repressor MraZ [Novosphingobium album (ex Liu et al. 2023)]